nr:hypothetical protein [Nostoc sp. 2RC]
MNRHFWAIAPQLLSAFGRRLRNTVKDTKHGIKMILRDINSSAQAGRGEENIYILDGVGNVFNKRNILLAA